VNLQDRVGGGNWLKGERGKGKKEWEEQDVGHKGGRDRRPE